MIRAAETVSVTPGQLTPATFTLSSGVLKVRLLDAEGAPAPQVAMQLRGAPDQAAPALLPTDDDGRTTGEGEVGTYAVQVLPKALQSQAAIMAFYKEHIGEADPLAAVLRSLGTVTLRVGETTEVELRLPADWAK